MAEEYFVEETELQLTAIVSKYKNRPQLILTKCIKDQEKIKIISKLILNDGYIPCRIMVKDKLKFYANLKEKGLI